VHSYKGCHITHLHYRTLLWLWTVHDRLMAFMEPRALKRVLCGWR